MEHELQGKLVEILTSIQSGVGQAKDFALSQLPDIAQSYIAYGRTTAAIDVFVVGMLLAAASYGVYRFFRWLFSDDGDGDFAILIVFLPIAIAVLLIWFVCCVESALLVWLAPKVWLLKELAHLVK